MSKGKAAKILNKIHKSMTAMRNIRHHRTKRAIIKKNNKKGNISKK